MSDNTPDTAAPAGSTTATQGAGRADPQPAGGRTDRAIGGYGPIWIGNRTR